jgi:hypothetical protein
MFMMQCVVFNEGSDLLVAVRLWLFVDLGGSK